ncbi:MAG: VanZ family protein [bacterium]
MLKKLFFALAILYTVLLGVISLIPLKGLPSTGVDNFDKIAHFIAYFLLYSIWFLAMRNEATNIRFTKLIIACIVYGIILEAIQGKLPSERSADYLDAVANTVGVLSSVLVMYLLRKLNVKMQG